MRWKSVITAVLVLLVFCCLRSQAGITTSYQAELVVKGWLTADPRPLDTTLGQNVTEVETFKGETSEPIYYIVHLDLSGFVIVPADDLVEPIIGFSDGDKYDPSPESPLGALVTADLTARIDAVRTSKQSQITSLSISDTQNKWHRFIEIAESRKGNIKAASIDTKINTNSLSDFRVAPLIKSDWSQGDICSQHCFNYYTPKNYGCGCVATAMAQLMRYHCHPIKRIDDNEFTIKVEGNKQTAKTRGGDGQGGPYMWDDMVYIPDCDMTETQRQAIGALCYDAGVSTGINYTPDGSGTTTRNARYSLTKTFQYSNAIVSFNGDQEIGRGLTEMINPNLDAKYPVILALSPAPGHAVLADGYGYNDLTLYHHINLGWSDADDIWYNLPEVRGYNVVGTCIYNVFPQGSGEIISGRVTDTAGNPLDSTKVTAQGPGGPYSTSADSRGIYAFPKLPSDSYFVINAAKAGYMFEQQITGTGTSYDNELISGNKWKVDFVGAIPGDWNRDNIVNLVDFATFAAAWRSRPPEETWNPEYDISSQSGNIIDILDLVILAGNWLARASDVLPVDPGANGLIAYYPLTNNVLDASGNSNNGILRGVPTYVDGPVGYGTAIHFSGTGNYVDLGKFNPSAGTGKITVALWAKCDEINGWHGLIGKRNTHKADDMMWEIEAENGSLSIHSAGIRPYSGAVLSVGEWIHITVTFDGTTATFYINGEKTGSGPFTFGSNTEAHVQFGVCGSDLTYPFNGALDEIRIYNRALSQGEVGWLAGRTTVYTNSLVAYYPLSYNVLDASGNDHDGVLRGAATYLDGPTGYGKAMYFGGAGNFVDLGTFNPSVGTGKITVALWARWDGLNGKWQGLIGKRDTWNVAEMMWQIEASRDKGILRFLSWGSQPYNGDPNLPVGEWTHVAVTFDGTIATFYVDGESTGFGQFSFGPDTGARLQFGDCGAEGYNPFNGALDEIRIYNQALSQAEVGLLSGKTELYTMGLVAYYPLSGSMQDASGNGHDGDMHREPNNYVEGPAGYGTAMEFGEDCNDCNFVDIGTFNPSAGTGKITVALWAKWNGLNGKYQGLIGKRDTWDAADMMWQIQVNNETGSLGFYREGSQPYVGDPVLPIGEWAHVAATFDGVVATFYVNGEKTGSGLFTFGSDTKAQVRFGDCRPEGDNRFNGALDEIRIYNRALSQIEVGWLAGKATANTQQ